MDNVFYDPIVAEVRKNREELLADFDGDMKKLDEYIEAKRVIRKAVGVRYETEAEREVRFAWNRQRREADEHRGASL